MTTQEFVTIITVSSLFAALLNRLLLALPSRLWKFVVDNLTMNFSIKSSDELHKLATEWLCRHPYSATARNVKLVHSTVLNKDILVPGIGTHFMWHCGQPLILKHIAYSVDQRSSGVAEESGYTFVILGRSQKKVSDLIESFLKLQEQKKEALRVYTWGGWWRWLSTKLKRSIDTIFMDESLKSRTIAALVKFGESQQWYVNRGIPWRFGMLIYGPPGTGKTSFATALAGVLNRPLYSMNLSSIPNDEILVNAFMGASENGIILIEDADAFQRDRAVGEQPPSLNNSGLTPSTSKSDSGITMSGLLNAIDGVAATEGRILIMTTNYIDRLDSALVRAGRIDLKVEIGNLPPQEVGRMFRSFFPEDRQWQPTVITLAEGLSWPAADWQKLFIKYQDDAQKLVDELMEKNA